MSATAVRFYPKFVYADMSANLQNIKFMKIRGEVLELSCIRTDRRTVGPKERCPCAFRKDANTPVKNNCVEQSASSEAINHLASLETSTFFLNRKIQYSVYENPPLKVLLLRDVPPGFTFRNSITRTYSACLYFVDDDKPELRVYLNIHFVPRTKHHLSVIKSDHLMLC